MSAVIKSVEPDSIASEIGLEAGDEILKINNTEIKDVLDYRFLINDEEITLTVLTKQGEEVEVEFEKDAYEPLGVEFENSLMDKPLHCTNKCVFCFIDQLPKGMRESLYFKDDDTRLSFFQGNYVTLTNLSDDEIDRIIRLRISPINISVHTMNPDLRVKMLKNPKAARLPEIMQRLSDNGIIMNCQIVLCPNYNDGDELSYTIEKLYEMRSSVKSVSVVPIGLTKHREGLCEMTAVDSDKAKELITEIEKWQKKALAELGTGFVYASDEIYLKAGVPIPESRAYHGFPQIENGVGMIASLREELTDALTSSPAIKKERTVTLITGAAVHSTMCTFAEDITKKYPNIKINVEKIINNFFGEQITVSGLLCGCDIIEQLRGKDMGDNLIITKNMLRDGENVLLDDVTTEDIERELDTKIIAVGDDGYELLEAILGN
ncbi:MAG: DUF512 domain-containing protein [Ruminococcaceae bacterium]|nr:DUF512 domain-containing protein [Oscillospiraceae bacterium]